MFQKVLIANRGEIALRINRACHELGIATVAVYSEADADALHVKFADESVCIGPASVTESYLNMPALLAAAEVTGADAVHPGYGFLSENSDFCRLCLESGLSFIGPQPDVIEKMGHKIQAKDCVQKAGVPLLPSVKLDAENKLQTQEVLKLAEEIGYPVLIKAAKGGGGRGMKLVNEPEKLEQALRVARSESKAAFGSDEVYIEKYCVNPRHIEFQIMGDRYGNVLHFGERDCSIQRRHQKLVEEAPSPFLNDTLRKEMGEIAVAAAKAVDYVTAGTIEFIVDEQGRYFFLEMNTRIQVEHPVTEMVTGLDLVRLQIQTAAGEQLKLQQDQIQIRGHAIECRITAEDPLRFTPSPGMIKLYHPPFGFGVRLESAASSDYFVSPYYDSMIAKLIVHDEDRPKAILKLREALREFVIQGIKTTLPFHLSLTEDPDFVSGNYTTAFLENR